MSNKNSPYRKEKNVTALIEDADEIRRKLDDKAFRREDGVLQCPTVYAEGYGFKEPNNGL